MKIENKTPIAEEIIRNNPTGYGLFAGIGDNFNSVAQVICELMTTRFPTSAPTAAIPRCP